MPHSATLGKLHTTNLLPEIQHMLFDRLEWPSRSIFQTTCHFYRAYKRPDWSPVFYKPEYLLWLEMTLFIASWSPSAANWNVQGTNAPFLRCYERDVAVEMVFARTFLLMEEDSGHEIPGY